MEGCGVLLASEGASFCVVLTAQALLVQVVEHVSENRWKIIDRLKDDRGSRRDMFQPSAKRARWIVFLVSKLHHKSVGSLQSIHGKRRIAPSLRRCHMVSVASR